MLPTALQGRKPSLGRPDSAREEPASSDDATGGGGGNEKNANFVVEILHLASLMRDQGDQRRGQL